MVLYIDEKFSQYEIIFRNSFAPFAEFRIKSYQAHKSPFAILSHKLRNHAKSAKSCENVFWVDLGAISKALNCKLHYAELGFDEGSYV